MAAFGQALLGAAEMAQHERVSLSPAALKERILVHLVHRKKRKKGRKLVASLAELVTLPAIGMGDFFASGSQYGVYGRGERSLLVQPLDSGGSSELPPISGPNVEANPNMEDDDDGSGVDGAGSHTCLLLQRRTCEQLMRVRNSPSRVACSNQDPLPAWRSGAQLVPLNFQTPDLPLKINEALFAGTGTAARHDPGASG